MAFGPSGDGSSSGAGAADAPNAEHVPTLDQPRPAPVQPPPVQPPPVQPPPVNPAPAVSAPVPPYSPSPSSVPPLSSQPPESLPPGQDPPPFGPVVLPANVPAPPMRVARGPAPWVARRRSRALWS